MYPLGSHGLPSLATVENLAIVNQRAGELVPNVWEHCGPTRWVGGVVDR